MNQANQTGDQATLRSRNVRLGIILASVAAVFFVGFVARLILLKH